MPGQVDGLHQGHTLGSAGHTFLHHAVVGGKHQQMLALHFVVNAAGDACQLHRQILQPSQAAGRLGQLRLALPGLVHGNIIQRLHNRQFHGNHPFVLRNPLSISHCTEGSASISSRVAVAWGHRVAACCSSSSMGMVPSHRSLWVSQSPWLL